jgi:hypothetical protein
MTTTVPAILALTHTKIGGLTRKPDRARFAQDVENAVAALVPEAKLTRLSHEDGELVMGFTVPGKLSCTFRHGKGSRFVPFVSWYGAASRLRGAPGAWHSWDVNGFHGCKATSFPMSLNALISTVVVGLLYAANGSAFKEGGE